ncbi:MAG: PEP-utilizing enzyme [Patescibacteria group bacterium]
MIQPKDYQLLFQIETNHLISDLFAQHYKNLHCLLVLKDKLWKSYIPVEIREKTLDEGLGLYGDTNKFNEFKTEFENYRGLTPKKLEKTLSDELTPENIKEFLLAISGVWKFYSKTEFFYTDKAAAKLIETGDTQLKNNLKELEQIKNEGRSFMNSLIFTENCYLNRLLALISTETRISKEDLKWYGIEEISEMMELGDKEITNRKKFFAMLSDGKELRYIYSDTEEFDKFFLFEDKKEIRGTIANKGIIRGKVKVIPQNYYADFSILKKLFEEMGKGDILVAETTSPELMPACSKAGAIITNQGGLLSHAAIVSRELNIPCIIGTGNATEILKDGDMIEVDANNGVVKILKNE